ncbi:hypothetical protein DPMN_165961 [Dreissena polymorpha]|uniref:Uncharacterized protein n=1 Tax=Dreissena polymorpha TaxID=45954 RepID=A0A9D4F1P0_DREPO|nr:hypothetical protein DPMN_165961 [Dreissena polymorpha]
MADIIDADHRRPRQCGHVNRQLTDFDDDELRRRYRFSTASIDTLEDMIGHRLQRRTRRNQPLTPRQQMIALRFYASGNFLQLIRLPEKSQKVPVNQTG